MLSMNEAAAQVMEHLVTCPSHGYSQYSRWGIGNKETIKLSDGTRIKVMRGDRDCSSAIIDAYRSVGLPLQGATYTGNMRKAFLATGQFRWHPGTSYSARRGDIYLNEACHTAMCVSPYGSKRGDLLAEFSISENGTIDGREGDQTGHESHIQPYYNYPWDGILEYIGKHTAKPTKPRPNKRKVNVTYQLKLRKRGWLDAVTNYNNVDDEGFAGYPYEGHDGFSAKVSRGRIRYQVHRKGDPKKQWSRYYYDGERACVNGVIDGINIDYFTNKGEVVQHAHFRSQTTKRTGYLPWCVDNARFGSNRWCGIYGEPLDRLQMYID